MDQQNALARFLFLGTTAPHYIRPKANTPVTLPAEDVLNTLCQSYDPAIIINVVKKVIFVETIYISLFLIIKLVFPGNPVKMSPKIS